MKYSLLLSLFLLNSTFSFAQKQFWGLSTSNDSSAGVIFKTDAEGNNYEEVYTFDDADKGTNPHGSLILADDNKLYGLSHSGGSNNWGTIFQFDPQTELYTKKHAFDSINGKNPYGSLLQASNGKLYGLTHAGGFINRGVLFEYDIENNQFQKIEDFDMSNGGNPYGSLIQASNGKLYGLSSKGGGDGTGALYEYDYNTNELTLKNSFILGPSGEGYDPRGSLIEIESGVFYGYSRFGQLGFESGGGVFYKFDTEAPFWEDFTPLYVFDETAPENQNGYELMGSPILASNGKIYGMTNKGGLTDSGTIFEYDLDSNSQTKLYDFDSATDGFAPFGSLMEGSNGLLYGLTSSLDGQAKLFQFDPLTNNISIKTNVSGTPYYTNLIEIDLSGLNIDSYEQDLSFKIYPNPSGNFLKINFENQTQLDEISITNLMGETVFQSNENPQSIDISQLANSIYFLNVSIGNKSVQKRFIKQN